MKKSLSLLLALLLLAALPLSLASCGGYKSSDFERADTETDTVLISVKDYGDIVVELYPVIAPVTVANFKKLVGEKFYTETIFHRVIEDFMIQGGISATGKTADPIMGEFLANGFRNDIKHERGVISMARTDDPNSASSQFFIVHETSPHLDGSYAAFGRVIAGIKVVDKIAKVRTGINDRPITNVVVNEIYFVKLK